jgi:hypothetical protein
VPRWIRARQSREAFSASLQESEAHRQMWEQSRSGQLGANLQLQDHFIQDFLLPKVDFNYETAAGDSWATRIKLRPYIDEYTAQNYDRMLGELAGGVQGADAVGRGTRPIAAGFPVPVRSGRRAGGYLGQVTGRAAGAGVSAQGRPSDQTAHTAMREFSTNAYAIRDRKEGAAQTHQENATPTDFSKLNPCRRSARARRLSVRLGKLPGRVVEGLSGDDPGQYVRDTLAGKKKP